MLPDPLHPALVHFPIVLMVLLPLVAAGALLAIRRGAVPTRAWLLPVLTAAALGGSAWLAVETGEGEEDAVEEVVPESSLHQHEEFAERFLILSGAILAIAAAGLARGTVGQVARGLTLAGSVALVGLGVQVGHSGGNLVYRDGAASAYTTGSATTALGAKEGGGDQAEQGREAEEDDD